MNPSLVVRRVAALLFLTVHAAVAAPEISVEPPAEITVGGPVVAWGYGAFGQTSAPDDLSGVRAIAAGGFHTVALKRNGAVVTWGDHLYGQTNLPAGLAPADAIAAGWLHTAVLHRDGTVVAWGDDAYGQSSVPSSLTNVQAIAAGGYHTVALKHDGTVVAWGDDAYGQSTVPSGLTNVQAISAGWLHTVALKTDGTVVAWGDFLYGRTTVPAGLAGVKAIAAGGLHTVALKHDGTVVAWGFDGFGQSTVPPGLNGVQAIAAGYYFTAALKSDGTVVAWGNNADGQTTAPTGLSGVHAIAAGDSHTVALVRRAVFGERTVGTASTAQTFTIENSGDAALSITSVSVAGENADDFSVSTAGMASSVSAASATEFTVTFVPGAVGARKATLLVQSSDAVEDTYAIALTGAGVVGTGLGNANARLASLDCGVELSPNFAPAVTQYAASVPFETASLAVTPVVADAQALVKVNGVSVVSGSASGAIALTVGENVITTVVRASDAVTTRTYTITITRAASPTPVPPFVATTSASAVGLDAATLHGLVNAFGKPRSITFDFGLTTAYGSSITATPGTLATNGTTPVSASLTGLLPHTQYYYRVRASGDAGTAVGLGQTFTTGNTAPVAVNDDVKIVQGTSVLDVTANDADADGDAAHFAVMAIVTPPPAAAGRLVLRNGALTFVAAKAFLAGTASPTTFTYRMTDGFGGTSIATATLTFDPGSLTISPPAQQIDSEGGTYSIDVNSSGPWAVAESLTWARVTPDEGDASEPSVQITVSPNRSKTARSGTIRIGNATHTITQLGVTKPTIGPLEATDFDAIVGGPFSLAIPTDNGPVIYTARGLPKGLTLSHTTGIISGVPIIDGDYPVTVTAKNASAAADETLAFTIHVKPLGTGIVGTFHGLIERSSELNGILGSRIELTTTASGVCSGKIISGTRSTAFKGLLSADPASPHSARLVLPIPSLKAMLDLTFDDESDSFTGTLGDDTDNAARVQGWRNAWAGLVDKAADVAGFHSFSMAQADSDAALPQGFGYGSFAVNEKTGALKISGELADGTPIVGTTFVGQDGQVLLYAALYGGRGSVAGVLTLHTPDHAVTGEPDWFKPAPTPRSKDNVYAAGFGPLILACQGGRYLPPAAGELVLGLTPSVENAVLEFDAATPDSDFAQPVTIANPKPTGLTNTALIATNARSVKITRFNAAAGTFEGEFTLPGTTAALHRKALFSGQIARSDSGGDVGHGYFLLPQTPSLGETVKTSPQRSGKVLLRAVGTGS
jgi:Cadherin-like beta sandwich domain/Putative Ig domain/Regulator of chromosome condensation (RCC1) repeat/Viral BACON domain